jgi:hypothetical protein
MKHEIAKQQLTFARASWDFIRSLSMMGELMLILIPSILTALLGSHYFDTFEIRCESGAAT